MHGKCRRASVCREDVLTGRGANPRTGIISPYILDGSSEAGGENDSGYIAWVRNERETTAHTCERWKQHALGWSLVECTNGDSDPEIVTRSSHHTNIAVTTPEQLNVCDGKVLEVDLREVPNRLTGAPSKTNQSLLHNPSQRPPNHSKTCSQDPILPATRRRVPSESLFQIPRKEVGSQKSSPMVSPGSGQGADPVSNAYGKHVASETKASGDFLPAYFDKTAMAFHAYPLKPPSGSPSCDEDLTSQVKRGCSNLGIHNPHFQKKFRPSTRYASLGDSPSSSVNPNLENTYRRPEGLLPARLRGQPTLHGSTIIKNADSRQAAPKSVVPEMRPHIRRVQASTEVPVTRFVKCIGNTEPNASKAPTISFQEKAAAGQYEDRAGEEASSTSDSRAFGAIACAASKAFLDRHDSETGLQTQDVLRVVDKFRQEKPPSNKDETPIFLHRDICQPQGISVQSSQIRIQTNVPDKSPIAEVEPRVQFHNSSAAVHRKSTRNSKEVFDSLVAVVKELTSLIDFGRTRGYFFSLIIHAVSTFQQAPSAIGVLRSQNAKVWDYLLAIRDVLSAMFYTVVLLSVLIAASRLLEFLTDIGKCVWYPISLLLGVIRWMLLH